MPNIAITNYCNLKCPYCFADNMIQEQNKNISIENYIKLLYYLIELNNIEQVGIIGGEPTLHPQFKEILIETNKCANKNHTLFTLFTNGINLDPFIPFIGEHICILINCNEIKNMQKQQIINFNTTLQHLFNIGWFQNGKAHCGCNLYPDCLDYYWIWDIVDRYNLRELRCSVASPGGQYTKWRQAKNEYFLKMKPIFLNFCKEAQKRKVRLDLDCGHIPICYFNTEELQLIEEVCCRKLNYINCNPILDITPDLKVTPCFGSYEPVPLDFEKNWDGIWRHTLYYHNIPKALKNNQGNCNNCHKLQELECQGGCLAFASPS